MRGLGRLRIVPIIFISFFMILGMILIMCHYLLPDEYVVGSYATTRGYIVVNTTCTVKCACNPNDIYDCDSCNVPCYLGVLGKTTLAITKV